MKKSKYDPKADKKWIENNRAHRSYLSARSSARSFIKNKASIWDLRELSSLIIENLKKYE